jgi:hypothetical protein
MAATSTPAPTTLAELFNAASTSCSQHGDYAVFSSLYFDPTTVEPRVAKEGVISAAPQGALTAIGLMHNQKMYVYTMPFKYHTVGSSTGQHNNKIFAYKGEMSGGRTPKLVEVPDDRKIFNKQTGYGLQSVELEAYYQTDAADELAGEVDGTTQNATALTTRFNGLIPCKYVQYFLSFHDGMPLKYFWTVVYPLMKVDPDAPTFEAFINYMRLASTTSPSDMTISTVNTDILPLADVPPCVDDVAARMLYMYLPYANPQSGVTQGDTTGLAMSVTSLMMEQQKSRNEEREERKTKEEAEKAKASEKVFGPSKKMLGSAMFGTTDTNLWPTHFVALSSVKKSSRNELDTSTARSALRAAGEHELGETAGIMPGTLEQDLEFSWIMDPVTLSGGGSFNPFSFVPGSLEAAKQLSLDYSIMHAGGTPTLEECKKLLDTPTNLPGHNDSVPTLRVQLAFLKAKLPIGDPIIRYLTDHITAMEGSKRLWEKYPTSTPELSGLKGVYHLLFVALRIRRHITKLTRGDHSSSVGDAYEIIDAISVNKEWEPRLDNLTLASTKIPKFIELMGWGKAGDDGTVSTAGSTLGSASTASTGTGGPPAGGPPAKDPKGENTTVYNEKFNSVLFEKFKTSAKKSKDLRDRIAKKTLPVLPKSRADGEAMCLAWHSKGMCNTKCPRTADHMEYSADQYSVKDGLVDWCEKNYEK